jgi:ribose 5-phosphate isomerase B
MVHPLKGNAVPAETIVIASDHGAITLKEALMEELQERGYLVLDLGINGPDTVDYPDFADALSKVIREERAVKGVLMCGSGIGMSIAANRHREIRAALVHDNLGARLARRHNDANVLVMGGRVIGIEVAKDCLATFLDTEFEGGRHARRVAKMS